MRIIIELTGKDGEVILRQAAAGQDAPQDTSEVMDITAGPPAETLFQEMGLTAPSTYPPVGNGPGGVGENGGPPPDWLMAAIGGTTTQVRHALDVTGGFSAGMAPN